MEERAYCRRIPGEMLPWSNHPHKAGGRQQLMVSLWSAHGRGKGSNGEGAQPPRFGRQTPRWGDWPSCGDPPFQGRLFVPQSWVCLITGIELNVLFVRFPADTRHQLRDERPLLPPAQYPAASSPDLPLERFLSPPQKVLEGIRAQGDRRWPLDLHPCKSSPQNGVMVPRGSWHYG